MNTTHDPRLRRTFRATAGVACATALVTIPSAAHATSTHSTDDFDFDFDGLCAFTVHLTVHNEIDVTTQLTAHGSTELDHTVETDTISANGVTVVGLPYHYTVHRVLDSAGHEVSVSSEGGVWRFRLPDGSTFSAGGRVDFLTGDIVGSFRDHDFSPVCAALGG